MEKYGGEIVSCFISIENKLIFIHMYKVAGISITNVFKPLRIIPIGNKHFRCKRLLKMVGPEIWNDYFKFTFVRNPWDRLVSAYHFISKRRNFLKLSFTDWIIKQNNNDHSLPTNLNCQLNKLMIDDEMSVDFIGKIEEIEKDMDAIAKKRNLHLNPVPHKHYNNHKHYSYYYTNKTRDIVSKWHKSDIEYFEYEF